MTLKELVKAYPNVRFVLERYHSNERVKDGLSISIDNSSPNTTVRLHFELKSILDAFMLEVYECDSSCISKYGNLKINDDKLSKIKPKLSELNNSIKLESFLQKNKDKKIFIKDEWRANPKKDQCKVYVQKGKDNSQIEIYASMEGPIKCSMAEDLKKDSVNTKKLENATIEDLTKAMSTLAASARWKSPKDAKKFINRYKDVEVIDLR